VLNHGVLLPQKDGYFVLYQLVLMEEIRDPAELIFTQPTADKKAVAQMGKMVSDMTGEATAARGHQERGCRATAERDRGQAGRDHEEGRICQE
jgi:hypothetical protein